METDPFPAILCRILNILLKRVTLLRVLTVNVYDALWCENLILLHVNNKSADKHFFICNKKCHKHVTNAPKGIGQA